MNPERILHAETWNESSSERETHVQPDEQSFVAYNSFQQKWDESFPDYGKWSPRISDSNLSSKHQSSVPCDANNHSQIREPYRNPSIEHLGSNAIQDWDPRAVLNNLSFLEKKIHHLKDLVHLIVGCRGQGLGRPQELLVQQQLVTADISSILSQLISTAGSLLPPVHHILSPMYPIGQLGNFSDAANPSAGVTDSVLLQNNDNVNEVVDRSNQTDVTGFCRAEQNYLIEDQELISEDDADDGENLPLGSYEILQLEKEEILASHTHFCTICGKGFKRDANLRMHMRGHGDEYKTPAALAKPYKESISEPVPARRYSCPYIGCKRNRDHKKFQPLKTILCMKNHYKRTHCDKTYVCSRCSTKKFSVLADLKTHEKHCGRDKWLCSCGTTFSRKDKLFGHISLFQGHSPAISGQEFKGSYKTYVQGQSSEARNKVEQIAFNYPTNAQGVISFENVEDAKGSRGETTNCFSPSCDETSDIGGLQGFLQPPFNDPENSFAFLLSGTSDYPSKN